MLSCINYSALNGIWIGDITRASHILLIHVKTIAILVMIRCKSHLKIWFHFSYNIYDTFLTEKNFRYFNLHSLWKWMLCEVGHGELHIRKSRVSFWQPSHGYRGWGGLGTFIFPFIVLTKFWLTMDDEDKMFKMHRETHMSGKDYIGVYKCM